MITHSHIPQKSNHFHASHFEVLRNSFRHWVGTELLDFMGVDYRNEKPALPRMAELAFRAPCALLSHDASPDPVLTYGNERVLEIFELDWETLVTMPSRLTAEPVNRSGRARLLEQVSHSGFIDNYSGIRISKNGNRFRISRAVVWNLLDKNGVQVGQAAAFRDWEPLVVFAGK